MDNTQQALQQARELAISMRHSAGTWMVPGWDGHRVADLLERIAALSLPVEAPSTDAQAFVQHVASFAPTQTGHNPPRMRCRTCRCAWNVGQAEFHHDNCLWKLATSMLASPSKGIAGDAAPQEQPQTIQIRYERSGRCFWHIGCTAQRHSPPMKLEREHRDEKRGLLRCTACNRAGWYPYGSVGEVRCEELPASSAKEPAPDKSLDGYKERCKHGVRWENRCSACDAPSLHVLIERQLPTATFFRFDGDGQLGGWSECRRTDTGAVPMFTRHDVEAIVSTLKGCPPQKQSVHQAEDELAEMRQHGDADDAVAAAINLERAHLAGGAPQSVREQAVAWACTDYDGHVGLGLTKEDAKRNAPEFCNEFFPLYASPLPAVQTVRMLTDGEVFDAATNWFDDGGSGTERAVRLVRDAIDKFCEVNGLALHQAHQKEDRDGL